MKPSHVVVKDNDKFPSNEKLVRKFLKLCKKERIIEEYREKTTEFKSKSQKRKEKHKRALKRMAKEERLRKKRKMKGFFNAK